jgi:putative phosphoesterase
MRIAVISDIHGNLPALEAVVSKIRWVDAVMCLGDVVNYGPWSDACLELLYTLPRLTLLEGNHESLFLGKEPLEHELPLVQQFYHASFARFTRRDLIENLPLKTVLDGYLFAHTLNGQKIYKDTNVVPPSDCFIGHTHHAFHVERHSCQVVNPGSVGQNREALNMACYAMFDTATRDVALNKVEYAVHLLLNEMQALGYPPECMAYYRSKL